MHQPSTKQLPARPQDGFRLLIIDSIPYHLLNQLVDVDVISTEVRRSLSQASLEQLSADGALVRIDEEHAEQTRAHLCRLRRANLTLPLIGVACNERDESLALELLGEVLDDYLLDGIATAERVVHSFRQARRLRRLTLKLRSQGQACDRLRRSAMDRRLGLELLGGLVAAKNESECATALAIDWINELRDAHAPLRRQCSIREVVGIAARQTAAEFAWDGNPDLQIYADPRQVAKAISEIAHTTNSPTVRVRISTSTDFNVDVRLLIACEGAPPLDASIVPNVLARYPKHSLFEQSPAAAEAAMRLCLAKRLVDHNLGDWTFRSDGNTSPNRPTRIELAFPTRNATDVFSRYGDQVVASLGPDTQVTLLQARTPADAPDAGEELQSLLSPDELAFPALANELADRFDGRAR